MAHTSDHSSQTRGPIRSPAGVVGCVPPSDRPQLIERLLEQYRQQAFEAGYAQAATELSSMLVWLAESFLREHEDEAASLRRPLYAFVERLERSVAKGSRGQFVEGGLGI